jgi:hypothetical protein
VQHDLRKHLLLAAKTQVAMVYHERWLLEQQLEHSLKAIARSRALIERLDAHVAKLDPGAGLGNPAIR